MIDNQSIIETGNGLCKSIEDLQKKARKLGIVRTGPLMRTDDSGKYRIEFQGTKQAGSYVEDRAAAQRLLSVMKWWVKDSEQPLTNVLRGAILLCNPGEPDVLVAIYFMYPDGRVVRHTVGTGRRQTVNWGTE